MLLVDNNPVILESKDPLSEYAQEYIKNKDIILKNYKFPLIFVQARTRQPKELDSKGHVKMDIPIPSYLTYHAAARNSFGISVIWKYAIEAPTKDDRGRPTYSKNGELIPWSGLIVTENELDKAFFILCKATDFINGRIVLQDKARDADDIAAKEAALIEAKALLYVPRTQLVGKALLSVARSYGLMGIGNKSENQIRVEIAQKLEKDAKVDKQAYQKFILAADLSEEIKIKANISQALDEKKIVINYIDRRAEWVVPQGSPKSPIYSFTAEEFGHELDALAEWAKNEGASVYQTILKSITDKETLDLNDIKQVREWAKNHGIRIAARKNEDILADVKNAL